MTDASEPVETSDIRLIVGLGNPGEEYANTRHNLGFEVVERLADRLGLRFARQARERGLGPVKARIAAGSVSLEDGGEVPVMLVKPWTYMNLSGQAVAAYARHCRLATESIFVIVDDLNLPLGRIRIRPGGSPGGHNGLKSIQACLGSEGFPRLRVGIGVSDLSTSDMVDPDFVLGGITEDERAVLDPVLGDATDALLAWLRGTTLETVMSQFNARTRGGVEPSDS